MWLTEVRGKKVVKADGVACGIVRDIVAELQEGDHHPTISRLVIGSRTTPVLINREEIDRFDEDSIVLRGDANLMRVPLEVGALRLRDDELLLVRDVLDTQIVDISGHRLARVADVLLSRHEDRRWKIDAVDVGFGRVLHRLHFPFLARRLDEELIDWSEIHLTSPRGHDVQLDASQSAVHRIPPAELAAILEHLDTTSAIEVVETLDTNRVAEAIIAGHHSTGERLLRSVPTSRAKHIVDAMPAPHGERWRSRLDRRPVLQGRRFHRLHGWRRHGRQSGIHQ